MCAGWVGFGRVRLAGLGLGRVGLGWVSLCSTSKLGRVEAWFVLKVSTVRA